MYDISQHVEFSVTAMQEAFNGLKLKLKLKLSLQLWDLRYPHSSSILLNPITLRSVLVPLLPGHSLSAFSK
jgi:hypothetical protein